MPYLETVYRRTTQLDWAEVMTCPHCQLQWKGRVLARGHGSDQTTYGFGAQSAFENAGTDAFSRAVDAGKVALLRARCPRCRKRGGGVGSLVVKAVLLHGFLVALFTWVGRSLAHGGTWAGGSSPRLLPILILFALVLIPLTIAGVLRSVDRRVQREPLQEIESQAPARRPMNAAAPAPPRAHAAAPARRSAADSDSLELDVDRSWNKKG